MGSRSAHAGRFASLAAVLAVLLAWLGAAAPARADGPAVAPEFYGVNAHHLWSTHDGTALTGSAKEAALANIRDSGVSFVRMDFRWGEAEPKAPVNGSHKYTWAYFDSIFSDAARYGLRVYPMLCCVPSWVAPLENAPPPDPTDWAGFAAAFAARYGEGGAFWQAHPELDALPARSFEISNEPNVSGFWNPGPDAAAYARLYIAARQAIRGAVPGARVVFGALADTDWISDYPGQFLTAPTFVQQAWAAEPGLAHNVDAIAFHMYRQTVDGDLYGLGKFRQALVGLGESELPIDVNEAGWPTAGSGKPTPVSDPDARAALYQDLFDKLPRTDCEIASIAPFEAVGAENAAGIWSQNISSWFGLYGRDGSSTPSASAFAGRIRQYQGSDPSQQPNGAVIHSCGRWVRPSVSDGPAEDVGSAKVTLNATYLPHGLPTDATFQYGVSGYTQSVAAGHATGLKEAKARTTLRGLSPDTVYKFRLLATNADGTSGTSGGTFRTLPGPAAPQIDSGPGGAPGALVGSNTAGFSFSRVAGVESQCAIDGQAFAACDAGADYSELGDGGHTFKVRALDSEGTPGPPASYPWTVDTRAAAPTFSTTPAKQTKSGSARFAFAGESAASFECALDQAEFASCSSPVDRDSLAEGEHVFKVRQTDAAGNRSEPASYAWTVDQTAPVVTLDASPPAQVASAQAEFRFSVNEPGSKTYCSLETAAYSSCSSPVSYSGLGEGKHYFRVVATDPAGNSAVKIFSWFVQAPAG